jgi:chromosome partitioning protein
VVAVAAEKGGVGKTTTAVHLAHYLALTGERVLLLDVDSQGQAGAFLGVAEQDSGGMSEVIGNYDPLDPSWRPMEELIMRGVRERLDLVPNNQNIMLAEHKVYRDKNRDLIILNRLEEVRGHYDTVIIDVGPTVNITSMLSFLASDAVIIPVSPGPAPKAGVEGLIRRLDGIREARGFAPAVLGVVATMTDRSSTTRELDDYLAERFPGRRLGAVARSKVIEKLPAVCRTVFEHRPGTKGDREYRDVGERVKAALAAWRKNVPRSVVAA